MLCYIGMHSGLGWLSHIIGLLGNFKGAFTVYTAIAHAMFYLRTSVAKISAKLFQPGWPIVLIQYVLVVLQSSCLVINLMENAERCIKSVR